MNRRDFLKSSGGALLGLACAPAFLQRAVALGRAGGNSASKKILAAIFQRGAADGLSMVVPYGEKAYSRARPHIALPPPQSGNAESAIDLDGFFGLHPGLSALKPLYDARHLAVVHAVGSPDSTRSHFDAQDYMESATPGHKGTRDGWLNRLLLAQNIAQASPFRAVSFTSTLPRALMGPAPAVAMARIEDFTIRGGPQAREAAESFAELYGQTPNDILQETGREAFAAVNRLQNANLPKFASDRGDYPRSPFGQALFQIAQLVKADLGLEIAFTDCGGWDTHANQGAARGQLSARLQDFAQGMAAFYKDLGDRMEDVLVLTMTEFGRTLRENGSAGTDHGHASCLFVLGGRTRGGKVYSRWPGLEPEQLYEGRDLAVTTDFRDVFAEIAVRHLGVRSVADIFPNFKVSPTNFRGFLS